MDLGYTAYYSQLEGDAHTACITTAKKHKIDPGDIEDCDAAQPFCNDCPFCKKCPVCGYSCREHMVLLWKTEHGEQFRTDHYCMKCDWTDYPTEEK